MVDFIKILITDSLLIQWFEQCPKLIWHETSKRRNTHTFDRLQSKVIKVHKGISFIFYTGKLEIHFKPHYYKNNNDHNANDFSIKECMQTIKGFMNEFDIYEPEKLKIINLEYGLNALSPIPMKELIPSLTYHTKNPFIRTGDLLYSKISSKPNKNGNTINKYKMIKFYAKGIQFPQYADINTFRLEVKSKKSGFINTLGIFTLADLLILSVYENMRLDLLKVSNELLILYSVASKNSNKDLLTKYENTIFWEKTLNKSRNIFNYHRNNYLKTLDRTGYNIHCKITETVTNKLNHLFVGAV